MTARRAAKPQEPPHARVAASVAQSYRLDFATTADLCPQEAEPITEVTAKIVCLGDEDAGKGAVDVGSFHGWCVRWGRIVDGYDFIDAFDERGGEIAEAASLVWDFNAHKYSAGLTKKSGDLIVPRAISIAPEHRGKGIGLLAVWRFLDYFGGNASLAVLKPYPLNYGHREQLPDGALPDEAFHKMYDQFERTSKKEGTAKLARHWGKLGFKRLRDTEFFFLNMKEARPTLEDLIEVEE